MFLALLWLAGGLGIGWIGLAGYRGRLPPQHWAGIRLSPVMRSDDTWHAGHRAGGPWIAMGGAISAFIGLATLLLAPEEETTSILSLVVAVTMLAAIVIGSVVGARAARKV